MTLLRGFGQVDDKGKIVLGRNFMLQMGLEPDSFFEPGIYLEFKLAGPGNALWLTIRNRGPKRLTTVQEKIGLRRKSKWRVMEVEY